MRHRIFVVFILLECLMFIFLIVFSHISARNRAGEMASMRMIVRGLMLTDMAVWTAARYTRHPSQADLFTPFQDFPGSIEHFPAGSIIAPPESVKGLADGSDDKT
jgi:hypothetical protein